VVAISGLERVGRFVLEIMGLSRVGPFAKRSL